MIKFFRKIRQKLLSEGKTAKYIKYAFGEIVLVVIGILFALNVNNWNEQRKTEAKIVSIFADIMEELISDIEETEMPMKFYSQRDSTIQLVLSDRVTFKDYENNNIPYLNNLTSFYNRVNLTQHSYNNLISNLDEVPSRFKSVIADLNDLYNYNKAFVIETNEDLSDFIKENSLFAMRNYSWFYNRNESDLKRNIEFKLEDFRYKNEVNEYQMMGTYNQLRMSLMYRNKAIECYKKIAELLNKQPEHESFIFDKKIREKLIGEWYVVGEPDIIYTYFVEDNRLFVKNNLRNNSAEVFYLPMYNKILDRNLRYGTFVKEGDKTIIKFNYFDLKRVD
jgi:hypothetical protein